MDGEGILSKPRRPAADKTETSVFPAMPSQKTKTMQLKSSNRGRIGRSLAVAALGALAGQSALADTYSASVAADHPLGYYRFNEPAPTANTSKNLGSVGASGNATNINLHLVGGAIVGSRNPAAYFDSTARTIIPFNPALNPDNTKDFTIEAWFYPTSDKVQGAFVGPAPIMNRYSGSVANRQGWVYFQRNPDDTHSGAVGWNFRTYTGVGSHVGVDITSGVPYKLGQWQHVVTVWDGASQTATMYIDGEETVTGANTSADPKAYTANTDDHGAEQAKNGAAGLSIGSYNNTETGSNPFRGGVDEVAFYAKKLTAEQIKAHYQNATNAARATAYETLVQADAPVGYWRLDDATGGPDVAVNMGLLQNAGPGANSAEVLHPVAGSIAGSAETAYAYHWRNGNSSTDLPWLAENNPDASVPFTVEAWFRPTSDRQNPGASPINNRYVASGNRTGWVFFQRAPNDTYAGVSGYSGVGWNFRMYTGSGGSGQDVTSHVPYKVGEWQHVVATWDGASTSSIYVNGELADSNSGVTYAANTNPAEQGDAADLAIGSYNKASGLGSNPFEGDVAHFALYNNIALSPDQILEHYQTATNALRGTNYSTLVLTAPYDQAGTQALQPATYLPLGEPAAFAAVNSGSLGDSAPGALVLADDTVSGPTPSAFGGFDAANGAILLNGSKAFVSLDNPPALNISGQITLEAWVKPATVQGAVARIVSHGIPTLSAYNADQVSENGSVLAGSEVFLRMEEAGSTYVVGSSDGVDSHTASFPVPSEDLGSLTWIHLVGTYDGANWKLFRNGVQVASVADTVGALPVADGRWAIGSTGNGWADAFAGEIDEVAIYDHSLTAARVAAHYSDGKNGAAKLAVAKSGKDVVITWGGGTLQQADNVAGPYTDLAAANSPYTPQPQAARKFYRLKP